MSPAQPAEHAPSSAGATSARMPRFQNAPELDVFRGIAALLMILNHAGIRLLSPADATTGVSGIAVFVGSFAPVLFFFATGFGVALGSTGARRLVISPLVTKALLLLLADQFFAWKAGAAWGFDFFSFIALAMVVTTLIGRSRRALLICLASIVLLLCLRYGIGPMFRAELPRTSVASWVLGTNSIDHVSYPLSPWMVYPLLGFIAGALFQRDSLVAPRRRVAIVLACMFGSFAIAFGLALVHSVFFRWGTVSLAYFTLSLGVLAAAWLLASLLEVRWQRLAGAVSLRGVSSFAVIPVHYLLLDVCSWVWNGPMSPWFYWFAVAPIAWLSLRFARSFAARLDDRAAVSAAGPILGAALLVLVMVAVLGRAGLGMGVIALVCFFGQMAVACLLGINTTRPRHAPAPRLMSEPNRSSR